MYGSPSAYPPAGYPLATTSSPNPYHPPPPQEYCSQPHNPYPQPPAGYPNHLQYHQPPYVRADSPQIISLAHQVNQDPNPVAFLTFYRRILDELTANSKYIINHATIIASELLNRANDIARCLDDHIMQCHPEHRLFALYALDSICKNVGVPYVTLLSQTIPRIFLETYKLVEQRVKVLMEQLLATWRDGGINETPLFGNDAQWTIEREIFGAPQPALPRPQPQQSLTPQHHFQSTLQDPNFGDDEQGRAILEIDRLLEIGSIEQSRNPENHKNKTRMNALSQLKAIVRTTAISPIEMGQINQQLASLSNEFRSLQIQQQQEQEQRQRYASPTPGNGTPSHVSNSSMASALAALSNLKTANSASGTPPPSNGTPVPESSHNNGNSAAANDLIKSLMQAGLLPSNSNPQVASTSAPITTQLEPDQDEAYTSTLLSSLSSSLTTLSLSKTTPPLGLVLTSTSYLPLQCKQCANRYSEDKNGRKNLQLHLDWHFRQSRRAKESRTRGMYRGWNAKLEDWIRGGHDDSPVQAGSSTEESSLSALSTAQETSLKVSFDSAFVITPTDPEVSSKPCPICKEPFKSEWSEDEEEWIWGGTIKGEKNIYYHASCHHSAKTLKESVASSNTARGASPNPNGASNNSNKGSRNNTPKPESPVLASKSLNKPTEVDPISRVKEDAGIAASPPVSGSPNGNSRKRKAEDEGVGSSGEQDIFIESAQPQDDVLSNGLEVNGGVVDKEEDLAPPTKKVAT